MADKSDVGSTFPANVIGIPCSIYIYNQVYSAVQAGDDRRKRFSQLPRRNSSHFPVPTGSYPTAYP